MAWVKLSDTAAEDPRLEDAGPQAFVLHIAGLCYCNRNLTDGRIGARTALRLWSVDDPQGALDALVRVGVWALVDGEYEIVDYLRDQPSRAHVEAVRAARAKSGARGGVKSGESRRTKTQASAKQVAEQDASRPLEPRPVPLKTGRARVPGQSWPGQGQNDDDDLASARPECEHGQPGGRDLLPNGTHECPKCRRGIVVSA